VCLIASILESSLAIVLHLITFHQSRRPRHRWWPRRRSHSPRHRQEPAAPVLPERDRRDHRGRGGRRAGLRVGPAPWRHGEAVPARVRPGRARVRAERVQDFGAGHYGLGVRVVHGWALICQET
jgi:hypothetical protein